MKVMFIRPPETFIKDPRIGIPVGTLSVAAVLEKAGHEIKVFDSLLYRDKVDNPLHFGASWQHIEDEIKGFSPDVIGIAGMFSTQAPNAITLISIAKKVDTNMKLITGGSHATVRPTEFLDAGIDMVIVGEGEYAALDIIEYFSGTRELKDVRGAAYYENGHLKVARREFIKNLDELPIPAYHLVDMEQYFQLVKDGYASRPLDIFHRPMREITMITSRGCPFECTFCSIHPTMGYPFRAHSPEYVVNHIQHVVEHYGIELIHFEDDNLTLDPNRFEKILDMLKERNIHVEWDTPNGTRADTLSRELLGKMKKMHVRELRIAIESADQQILNTVIRKDLDLQKVIEVCKNCFELDVPLSAFYLMGMPGETKEHIQKTLDLAYMLMKNYNVKPHVNIVNPIVGTELYNMAKRSGYLASDDYTKGGIFSGGRISTEHFTPEYLEEKRKEFYRKVRRLYVVKMLKKPSAISGNIVTMIRYPKSTFRLLKTAMQYT